MNKYHKQLNILFNCVDTSKIKEFKDKSISKRKRKKRYKEFIKKERKRAKIPKKYPVYIQSKYWTKRKNEFWKKHKKICEICGSAKYIQLHHLLYKNFGEEKDEDLKALCHEHHSLFHEYYGTKYDMRDEWKLFKLDIEFEEKSRFINQI